MRKTFILIAACLACAGEAPEEELICDMSVGDETEAGCAKGAELDELDEELGTLEQGLTLPLGYGSHVANWSRCLSRFSCRLPTDKTITYRFYASTCNAWWQARFVTAVDNWVNLLGDVGWTITHHSGNNPDYILKCDNNAGASLGGFTPASCSGADPAKCNKGTAYVNPTAIGALPTWSSKTDTQRQRWAVNAIFHELGHGVGFGHGGPDGGNTTVMSGYDETSWYTTFHWYSDLELDMLADYVP